MGMYSFWHWLIVLFVLGLPLLSVYLEQTDKTIGRKDLFIWIAATLLLAALSHAIMGMGGAMIGMILYLWLVTGHSFLLLQRIVRRCRDLGWNKYWALLVMIPIIGLVFILILLIKRGNTPASTDVI